MTGPICRVTCPRCGRLLARRRDGTPYAHGCDMTHPTDTPDTPEPSKTPPPIPKPRKPERAEPDPDDDEKEPELVPDPEPFAPRPIKPGLRLRLD